ncbi:unnamed protein product [Durusdinium trenchii]|uniref:Uncharacterized protein n=1 Tax=Durusdinium trenchii TaxID=1381693 RepID=A0ABP0SA97_9DINO
MSKMDAKSYKDLCLIIVGPGSKADEVLARRRLTAGGRLAHILIEGENDDRVEVEHDPVEDSCLSWQPPLPEHGISSFGKKIGAKRRNVWTKVGPDAIVLPENHKMKILKDASGALRHICISDENQTAVIELSGHVVLNADMELARTLDVEVCNPDYQPFGCFSARFVLISMLISFLWTMARFLVGNALESNEDVTSVLWGRSFLRMISWLLFGQVFCVGMWPSCFAGEWPSMGVYQVGHIIFVVAILAITYFQFSDFLAPTAAEMPMLATAPALNYWLTQDRHPERRIWPSALWTIAQLVGSWGGWIIFALVGLGYGTLVASGNTLAAALFLPFATAATEIGIAVYARFTYNKFVFEARVKAGELVVAGDQLFLNGPAVIYCAHALAEACRLAATFSGAVISGGYTWVPTTLLSVALNISARLGWSRFALIKITTKIRGGPTAMAWFAPTAWSKLHDELKVYGGYFRFAAIWALVAARAIEYGWSMNGPKAPFFNTSAMCVLIACFILEKIEDVVVVHELLPVNPAGPGLLKKYSAGTNADPKQLVAVENLPTEAASDPWRMDELELSGRKSSRSTMTEAKVLQQRVSLGPRQDSMWCRLRAGMGQPRSLVPAPSLHGLREIPFEHQLCMVGCIGEFVIGLTYLLIGAGYMRGLCDAPMAGLDRLLNFLWWEVPLQC